MMEPVFLAALLFLRFCCVEPYTVSSAAMEPGLTRGDVVLVDKRGITGLNIYGVDLTDHFPSAHALPARGEIVAFRSDDGKIWLSRVIGQPGDHITLAGDSLSVNDSRVSLDEDRRCDKMTCRVRERIGDISYEAIYRRSNPYPAIEGSWTADSGWFVMGDNRDNSFDSRYLGTIETGQLRGRVMLSVDRVFAERIAHTLSNLTVLLL